MSRTANRSFPALALPGAPVHDSVENPMNKFATVLNNPGKLSRRGHLGGVAHTAPGGYPHPEKCIQAPFYRKESLMFTQLTPHNNTIICK